jgi:hypothetical protein
MQKTSKNTYLIVLKYGINPKANHSKMGVFILFYGLRKFNRMMDQGKSFRQ